MIATARCPSTALATAARRRSAVGRRVACPGAARTGPTKGLHGIGGGPVAGHRHHHRLASLVVAAQALRGGWALMRTPLVVGVHRRPPQPRVGAIRGETTKAGATPSASSSTPPSGAAAAASSDARQIGEFTTSELKRLLTERGVDFRDCLEKSELVQRLQKSLRDGASAVGDSQEASKIAQLSSGEQRTVKLFQEVAPSVAFITTSVVRQTSPLSMRGVEIPSGSGSGFVWDREGHVVTNFHVINQAQKASVTGLGAGDEASMASYDAVLVGAEPEKDIAVLKVAAPGSVLRPVKVGSSSELLVGQDVYAIGNPFGLDHTLTSGIVSAVGREVQGIGGRPIKGCVQTDAAINPGNSGGPLLDGDGRLIGVNTAILSPSGTSAGIGFAIPVDTVRRIVNQIIRFGRVLRPSIGVSVADDQVVRGLAARVGKPLDGVLVMDAPPGTPGADAGLVGCMRRRDGALILGDLITHVNDKKVKTVEDLLNFIEELEVGVELTLTVFKGAVPNKEEKLTVKTVERGQLAR